MNDKNNWIPAVAGMTGRSYGVDSVVIDSGCDVAAVNAVVLTHTEKRLRRPALSPTQNAAAPLERGYLIYRKQIPKQNRIRIRNTNRDTNRNRRGVWL
jgi:hypothetical protein